MKPKFAISIRSLRKLPTEIARLLELEEYDSIANIVEDAQDACVIRRTKRLWLGRMPKKYDFVLDLRDALEQEYKAEAFMALDDDEAIRAMVRALRKMPDLYGPLQRYIDKLTKRLKKSAVFVF